MQLLAMSMATLSAPSAVFAVSCRSWRAHAALNEIVPLGSRFWSPARMPSRWRSQKRSFHSLPPLETLLSGFVGTTDAFQGMSVGFSSQHRTSPLQTSPATPPNQSPERLSAKVAGFYSATQPQNAGRSVAYYFGIASPLCYKRLDRGFDLTHATCVFT